MQPTDLTPYQEDVELAMCKRDYDLMESYHLDLLIKIEKAVKVGATPKEVRRWARNMTSEADILQRVENAARYAANVQAGG